MRILIDLQACQSTGSRHRGIGRYSLALAQAMARNAGRHDLRLMLNGLFPDSVAPVRQEFANLIPAGHIHLWHSPGPVAELDPANRWRLRAGELAREQALAELRPDFVHVSSLFEGLTDDALTSIAQSGDYLPTAVTLYDLIPLINADPYLENQQVRAWYYRKVQALKRADLLLAISSSSRQEGLDWLHLPPERVVNISSAVDERFCVRQYAPAVLDDLRARYGLRRPYVMYTGGIDLRKNIEALIRAYAALPVAMRQQYQLAIVCSVQPADRERLQKLALQSGLQEQDMVLTGFVPDEDLPLLYHACQLFVFPSWHEGFGLPALEAMACGAPVIAANTSSLPEVVGRADALFDPRSETAITQKLHQALSEQDFRTSLRLHGLQQAQKFSWDASAKTALNAFEELHARRQAGTHWPVTAVPPTIKPRLAYFSPLPPERSGIADYSAELLPELASYYEIELIVDQEAVDDAWLSTNFPVRSWQWFDQHAAGYQRVLYNFGNSTFHTYMLDMLARHPGVVALHDFFLSGLIAHLELTGARPGIWWQALYHSHGYHAVLAMKQAEDLNQIIWKYPCNRQVLNLAEGLIVHSAYSAELAQQWYGVGATAGWRQVPHLRILPHQPDRAAARQRLGLPDGAFLVCSFGILGQPKLNHLLLEAWLQTSLAQDPQCHLVFVGQNDAGPYGAQLLDTISQSGMSGRIRITGFADGGLFRTYLQGADAAVQLRGLSRGETSGTVLDCMAHGVPTVINNNGSMAELPADSLIKLEEHCSVSQLAEQLELLRRDPVLRQELGRKALAYVRRYHDPFTVGRQYFDAIEHFFQNEPASRLHRTLSGIAALDGQPTNAELTELAQCVALNREPSAGRRALLDIAGMAVLPASLLSAILEALVVATPATWRLEPVTMTSSQLRHAGEAACKILDLPMLVPDTGSVELRHGDVLLRWRPSHQVNCYQISDDVLNLLEFYGISTKIIELNVENPMTPLNQQQLATLVREWWQQILQS